MKNIFKLIAVFAIAMSGFAFGQTKTLTESDYKHAMIDIVNSTKPYYTKGMTYEAFVQTLGANPKTLTNQANTFLKEIYGYVSKDSTDLEIFSTTSGASLKDVVTLGSFDNQGINETGKNCSNWLCHWFEGVLRKLWEMMN